MTHTHTHTHTCILCILCILSLCSSKYSHQQLLILSHSNCHNCVTFSLSLALSLTNQIDRLFFLYKTHQHIHSKGNEIDKKEEESEGGIYTYARVCGQEAERSITSTQMLCYSLLPLPVPSFKQIPCLIEGGYCLHRRIFQEQIKERKETKNMGLKQTEVIAHIHTQHTSSSFIRTGNTPPPSLPQCNKI